ncbi:hypothetical protein QBC34DRAFT_410421 [Podospora aff. communis PSN243]|uniref:Uncharacterized protein n=1 Tax=Podospora aff. communis PSN243 TaxID=3040156 RepID=A0AAV9GG07_9PEZI|nr:hypothetical protein QBC34DRAFT_410421 [Podospora aff. communis PSN243]
MPAFLLPPGSLHIRQSSSFPSSNSSFNNGIHPAAIFGIVAGVMFLLVITIWCGFFRVWKRMMTNKEYGVLPSMRIAANNVGGNNSPYGAQPPVLNSPYGPQPTQSYGLQPTSSPYGPQSPANTYGGQPTSPYPPYGSGPYDSQDPPPYAGAQTSGLVTQPPPPSHSRSPSTASNKPLPPVNKPLPSPNDPYQGPHGEGSQRPY